MQKWKPRRNRSCPPSKTWLVGEVTRLCALGQVQDAIATADKTTSPLPRDAIYPLLRSIESKKNVLPLEAGIRVHNLLIRSRLNAIAALSDHLIRFFTARGSLHQARNVFSQVSKPSVYTWSAIISCHAELGDPVGALEFFAQMLQQQESALQCDRVLYLSVLKACSSMAMPVMALIMHHFIVSMSGSKDVLISNTVVDVYSKCGMLDEAQAVFDLLLNKTVVSYAAMIIGYASNDNGHKALQVFADLQAQNDMIPSKVVYLGALKACASIKRFIYGCIVHQLIIQSDFSTDTIVCNSLVDMYSKCGSLEDAMKVFHCIPTKTVASWGAVIASCLQQGEALVACEFYETMCRNEVKPDDGILWCILRACADLEDRVNGMVIHDFVIKDGLDKVLLFSNTLIDLYMKCGCVKDAHRMFNKSHFRDEVSWGAMIVGHARNAENNMAYCLFEQMQKERVVLPNAVIFSCILNVCGSLKATENGREIHKQVVCCDLEHDIVVTSALIDMYVKFGSLKDAQYVFNRAMNHNEVTWGALIAGYASSNASLSALELYERMQHEGVKPNPYIYSSILTACSGLGAAKQGRFVHNEIVKDDFHLDNVIGNALVDMYSRCGRPYEALRVFSRLNDQDVSSWGAIVAGFAASGNAKLAVYYLERMLEAGLKPDGETFTSVLSACSHYGLIKEGKFCFEVMTQKCGITPIIEHWSCMIDLFCRMGQLIMALDFLHAMSTGPPDAILYKLFLSRCAIYGTLELGRALFEQMFQDKTPNIQI